MARYTESRCKICRKEKIKLYLKGERCHKPGCSFEKREGKGKRGGFQRRRRPSEYALRLREKQKIKMIYGVLERQFRNYFERASRQKGVTGESLLRFLEGRLDNVIYRAGFAASRNAARQLVSHKHITVNDKSVNLPSYQVKPNDVVAIKEKSFSRPFVQQMAKQVVKGEGADWLQVDMKKGQCRFTDYPTKDKMELPIDEQMIVELYSK